LKVITIYVNGANRQIAAASTVAALIEELGYTGKRIAVECNGDIVPRSLHGSQTLSDDDKLEIVVAVGGG